MPKAIPRQELRPPVMSGRWQAFAWLLERKFSGCPCAPSMCLCSDEDLDKGLDRWDDWNEEYR